MPGTFYEQPILNSPYSEPVYHHPLDDYGQPLEQPAILGRRTSKFIVPVPKSRKASAAAQASLDLETYTPNSLINEIRGYVNVWRQIPNQADWGVTPASARLLDYWRNHQFSSVRPFFCQVEAVETIIWLTEVAPKRAVTKGLPAPSFQGSPLPRFRVSPISYISSNLASARASRLRRCFVTGSLLRLPMLM